MNQSTTIGKLAEALSKAQGQIEGARKDSKNPFFKSSYADLESVWTACRKHLSENGLAVIQTTEGTPESICLVTTLVHTSGEWMRGVLPICPIKHDPQSIGSALTYARRYSLASIVGVCQTDDDGEAAMSSHREKQVVTPLPASEFVSTDQFKEINRYISTDKMAEVLIKERLNISNILQIRKVDFEKILNWLKQRSEEERSNVKSRAVATA
jgi:ERF superfamily